MFKHFAFLFKFHKKSIVYLYIFKNLSLFIFTDIHNKNSFNFQSKILATKFLHNLQFYQNNLINAGKYYWNSFASSLTLNGIWKKKFFVSVCITDVRRNRILRIIDTSDKAATQQSLLHFLAVLDFFHSTKWHIILGHKKFVYLGNYKHLYELCISIHSTE